MKCGLFATSMGVGCWALFNIVACSDGSSGLTSGTSGAGAIVGTSGSGTGNPIAGDTSSPAAGTGGQPAVSTGGAAVVMGGSAGANSGGGMPPVSGGTGTGDSGGTGGTGGAITTPNGLRQGPFKMLMLSTTLVFPHPSIKECGDMLNALGKADAPERATISGLAADSTWTVDPIDPNTDSGAYFSEVTADNLAKHEMLYSNNPTGQVFTNAPDGANRKAIFQAWYEKGGAWAGQHSATDFEKNGSWTWFNDHVDGAWFVDHDQPKTSGTVSWQTQFADHPILKGLASPWNCSEEWYLMNRNVEAVAGFKVLAKVTVSGSTLTSGGQARPAIWITENDKGGRAFYTIRGHDGSTYAEPEFRQLMLRGILWSVHRLPGGN